MDGSVELTHSITDAWIFSVSEPSRHGARLLRVHDLYDGDHAAESIGAG